MSSTLSTATASSAELPFVTIVIPVFNEARYIINCLQSVWLQEYPSERCEVFIIDGGSTDGTRDTVQKLIAERPNWRMLDNPGRIQAKAFNIGLRHSRGEVLVRMDAHALYPSDYVRQCVATLQSTGAANVGGAWNIVPGAPGLIASSIAVVNGLRFGTGWARHRVGGTEGPIDSVAFGAFRKEVFDVVGPMDERFAIAEDKELNWRLRRAGLVCYFKPEIAATYFCRVNLRAFFRQMFVHGQSLVPSLKSHVRTCSSRHALPAMFVLALLFLPFLGFYWRPAFYAAIGLLAVHLLIGIVVSMPVCRRLGWKHMLVLPWLILLTHVSYGLGALYGIFRDGLHTSPNV